MTWSLQQHILPLLPNFYSLYFYILVHSFFYGFDLVLWPPDFSKWTSSRPKKIAYMGWDRQLLGLVDIVLTLVPVLSHKRDAYIQLSLRVTHVPALVSPFSPKLQATLPKTPTVVYWYSRLDFRLLLRKGSAYPLSLFLISVSPRCMHFRVSFWVASPSIDGEESRSAKSGLAVAVAIAVACLSVASQPPVMVAYYVHITCSNNSNDSYEDVAEEARTFTVVQVDVYFGQIDLRHCSSGHP